jgi:hypothetical protein
MTTDDPSPPDHPSSDPLQAVWQGQDAPGAPGGDGGGAEALGRFVRDRLVRELGRRQLRESLRVAHAAVAVGALVLLVGWTMAMRPPRGLALTLGLFALLIPPFGLLAARISAWRAGRRVVLGRSSSIADATRGSLAAVDQDLRVTRAVLLAQLATALLLPPVLWLGWRAGLMRPRDVLAQAGLFYSTLAAVALFLLHRRRAHLLPRRTELRTLLTALQMPTASGPDDVPPAAASSSR